MALYGMNIFMQKKTQSALYGVNILMQKTQSVPFFPQGLLQTFKSGFKENKNSQHVIKKSFLGNVSKQKRKQFRLSTN